MCGIVGATAQRNIAKILLASLQRLEYRGYDSAGIAIASQSSGIETLKCAGKVIELSNKLKNKPILGFTGIAHTRWATHGKPSVKNAHPHVSCNKVAVVHNGIIDNYAELKQQLVALGYEFVSDTDTEVVAHLIKEKLKSAPDLLTALQQTVVKLKGSYSIVAFDIKDPDTLVATRSGSPLVIGVGLEENFIASDQLALFPVTNRFIFLEEGDTAQINCNQVTLYDQNNKQVNRRIHENNAAYDEGEKGQYRHYMIKEINEQPIAINNTIDGKIINNQLNLSFLSEQEKKILTELKSIQIVACGTSYHAAMVARYWFEELVKVPCRVEIASEFRYRKFHVPKKCLFITLSQSGETADTLAALRIAKKQGYMSYLSICNVASSSMVRESDFAIMTRAGAEIGVASTKAFTTQLSVLLILVATIGYYQQISATDIQNIVNCLTILPEQIKKILLLQNKIKDISEQLADKQHCLFLGRGSQYPIAMEGALKLKEITYIHAEAYAAGELKHGPLALVDEGMPVIVVAPSNLLLEKLKANIEEVKARGGKLIVFADTNSNITLDSNVELIHIGDIPELTAPILFTVPLQLLSYYVAVIKGTDVDQPRNLAKSVTVE